MLIITRRVGQAVRIELDPSVDPRTPVGHVFAQGAIEIMVAQTRGAYVRLGVAAPACLSILRADTSRDPIDTER
ncbi:MAG TPA: carbon storage regulator [Burkholderiales bacterium]